jgi:hypothetical protein
MTTGKTLKTGHDENKRLDGNKLRKTLRRLLRTHGISERERVGTDDDR